MGRVLVLVCAVLLCVSGVDGAIRHQYTFNDGTANDSVGTRHGTVVDPMGIGLFVGGQFDMTANNGIASNALNPGAENPNGVYIDLGNDLVNQALAAGTVNAASFEMWITVQTNRTWARIFDFGASNGGEDVADTGADQDYIILVPAASPGQPPGVGPNDFAFSSHAPADADANGPETYIGIPNVNGADPQPLATGMEHHIVVTYDHNDLSAGCPVNHNPCNMATVQPQGTVNVYLNGELAAVGPINPDMLTGQLVGEVNDWLGRSQWGGDPLFDGSYNEFRVYDHVLSEAEVQANFMTGPVPAPVPTIVVDRETGNITIENQSGGAQQLIGYSITSAAGGLDISWDPIAPANGWTIDSQTEAELAESGPAQAINPGGMIDIGTAWIPSIFEDLQFAFEFQGGASGLGAVQFVGNNGQPYGRSDLNTDGQVDADDWELFLAGNKTDLSGLSTAASYLMGDLNNDGQNNHADFLLFRNDFIAAQGAAAFASLVSGVPEPTSLAMLALAAFAACGLRMRGLRRVLPVVAACGLCLVLQSQASADLVHRYSFNEGATGDASNRTIIDAVGGANGTVLGAGSSATADDLVLAGGASDTAAYVDLPNGLISQYTDITFEAWYTMSSVQTWTRVFDFGSNTNGEQTGPGGAGTASDNFFMAPNRDQNLNGQRIGYGNNDPLFLGSDPPGAGDFSVGCCQDIDPNVPQVLNQRYHIVVTFDEDGGSGEGLGSVTVYHDGGIAGGAAANPRVDITTKLGNLNDVNNWLGRSNWGGDANFGGTFHEFRIYDHPLSAEEVVFNNIVGPDVVAEPGPIFSLEVNTGNGQVSIKNNLPVDLNFNYYEINSPGGALNAGWVGIDGNTTPGQGWDQSGGADVNELVELFLPEAGFTLPANTSVPIGTAFNTSVFGAGNDGDLEFNFGLVSGALISGPVNYTSVVAMVDGDFNGDGVVNAADYVLWRNGGPLQNDPTPGVQAADYDFWVSRFGATSGAGSGDSVAVPEPAAWLCLAVGLSLLAARRTY